MAQHPGRLEHDVMSVGVELAAHHVHRDTTAHHQLGKVGDQSMFENFLARA